MIEFDAIKNHIRKTIPNLNKKVFLAEDFQTGDYINEPVGHIQSVANDAVKKGL